MKDAPDRMGFERRAYPHLLRASAIRWMVKKGMPPPMISEITGASISVIMQFYYESSDQERYDALMRLLGSE